MVIKAQDQQFFDGLKARLQPGAVVPLFFNDDGTLNRKKILDLPCFGDHNAAPPAGKSGEPIDEAKVMRLAATWLCERLSAAQNISMEERGYCDDCFEDAVHFVNQETGFGRIVARGLQSPLPCGHRKTNLRPDAAGKVACEVCEARAGGTELVEYARKQHRDCQTAIKLAENEGVKSKGGSKASRQMTFTRGAQTAYEDIIRHAPALAPSLAQPDRQERK